MQINIINSSNIVNNVSNIRITPFSRKIQLMPNNDIFVKSLSFGNSYNRDEAISLINKINNASVKDSGSGFQAKFYKINDNFGIKAPNPLYPENADADICGHNNVKENFVLNKIKNIAPDIVPKVHDLIEENGKYYLVMDIVNGKHPMDSALTKENLTEIIDKSFKLDTNGILHCDLQSGNIFLEGPKKVKFIDFGSYSILDDKGRYIDSDNLDYQNFFNNCKVENITKSNNKSKFTMALLNNGYKFDIKNYSDNPYLNIKSNISNFEYRTLYDYLIKNHKNQPIGIFKDYLNTKANTYHTQMVEFLNSLNADENGKIKINQAIEHEKLFQEVFKNPSENVIKTELGKIQIKWLSNDYQGKKYVKSALNDFIQSTQTYQQDATELEKKYFDGVLVNAKIFAAMQNLRDQPDNLLLEDNKNILKIIFENVFPEGKPNQELISKGANVVKKTNKKLCIIMASILSGIGALIYILNKKKNSVQAEVASENQTKAEGTLSKNNNMVKQNSVAKASL